MKSIISITILILWSSKVFANTASSVASFNLDMTSSSVGLIALTIFVIAYMFVITEEFTQLRKSKPFVLAAGLIWALVAWVGHSKGLSNETQLILQNNILEYAEILLFLLVAMTYIKAMEERLVFEALRTWLTQKNFSYKQLFWITGLLAFCISPVADNLTTALVMCAVVMAVGVNSNRFVSLACINVVVAANAGGAFSPFGDLTTLMVWQNGVIEFQSFFYIFIPAFVSYIVPAVCMSFAIPKENPSGNYAGVKMKFGANIIILLFLLTIFTAVSFHQFLEMPPVIGMMMGLSYLLICGYFIRKYEIKQSQSQHHAKVNETFDIFSHIKEVEWDTLLFFFGIILSVGGLATLGYMEIFSSHLYNQTWLNLSQAYQPAPANVLIGILSAIIDNIPIMYAVLTMNPAMSEGQWLLAVLTTGIGGSLLSIGSAAGVALMGQTKGQYTFFSHLKWSWAILLGYMLAIAVHFIVNTRLFF